MKLENQICTLQQAKRLKELGVIQESNYQWNLTTHAEPYLNVPPFGKVDNNGLSYSAFTVAELGVMCNSETYTWRTGSELSEYANWEFVDEGNGNAYGVFETEAQARAAMLIYLLENNLTTAAEVNERLNKS